MEALWLSFAVIFVAELGDKSQLMALTFATRYKAWHVLVGITAATALVHAISVLIGGVVSVNLPTATINIVAGIAFFGFAAWTLRGDTLGEKDLARAEGNGRSPILAVGIAFFFAELGDKTMLATVTLATTENLWATWIGSTLGMVAADALAIVVGRQLGDRIPERAIRIGAAVAFAVFGALLIAEGLRG